MTEIKIWELERKLSSIISNRGKVGCVCVCVCVCVCARAHHLDCRLRYLPAAQAILIQCDTGNDGRKARSKEAHKNSPSPAWDGKEGESGETFRERERQTDRQSGA